MIILVPRHELPDAVSSVSDNDDVLTHKAIAACTGDAEHVDVYSHTLNKELHCTYTEK